MKLQDLFEMSMTDAEKTFGIYNTTYDDKKVKQLYKKLSAKYHPDRGGDTKKMQDVNVAYDILKNTKGTNNKNASTMTMDEFETELITSSPFQNFAPFPNLRYLTPHNSETFIQFKFSKVGKVNYVQINGKGLFELDGGQLKLINFSKHKAAFNNIKLPTTEINVRHIKKELSKVKNLKTYEIALGKILNSVKL